MKTKMDINKNQKLIRTQFEISQDKLRELEALMRDTETSTKKDLINSALTLLEWAVQERQRGRIIVAMEEETGKYKELVMGPLMAAARRSSI
jgi:hypothetical protein